MPPVVPVVPVVRPVVVWTGRSYACDCQCPVVQATIWEADIQASATRQAAEQRAATANAELEHLKAERAEEERRAREELSAASLLLTLSIQAARAGLGIVADHRERSAGAMFQLAAMFRVGPMRWDREDQLDLAEIGGETGTATHGASIAGPSYPC